MIIRIDHQLPVYILIFLFCCNPDPIPQSSGETENQGDEEIAYIAMEPDLILRSGPGLKAGIVSRLPMNTRVKKLNSDHKNPEKILGVRGDWCRIQLDATTRIRGWVFCPFLKTNISQSGWAVIDGRAIMRNEKVYISARKLDKCIDPSQNNLLRTFSGGCFNSPCFKCDSLRLRPDGKITIAVSDYNRKCHERTGGSWKRSGEKIIVRYMLSLVPSPAHDAHIMESEKNSDSKSTKFIEEEEREILQKYGKKKFRVELTETIEYEEGEGLKIAVNGHDLDQISGKSDFGSNYDTTKPVRCVYRFSNTLLPDEN